MTASLTVCRKPWRRVEKRVSEIGMRNVTINSSSAFGETSMSSVLVVGNYRPSIPVVRSLGRAGLSVIVGLGGDTSFAERSRYCSEAWSHPPIRDSDVFIQALAEFLANRPDITLLFPVHQTSVKVVARSIDRLPDSVIPVGADPEVVATCLYKTRMFTIAESAKVPLQPYASVSGLGEFESAIDRTGFPTIIRPIGCGPERLPGGDKAVICRDRADLQREFSEWPIGHDQLLVQKYAPGPRHNVYFAAKHGRIIGRVEVVITRTDRLDGTGYAVEGISVSPDPLLDIYSRSLIDALGYEGVGCVQFVRTGGGDYHFLELNPRLGANYAIAERCGLDLARLACRIARETAEISADTKALPEYPAGLRYAWTFGDIRGLRKTRAQGGISVWESTRWAARALKSAIRADVHLTWSLRDPMPTLCLYAHWAPFGIGKRLFAGDSARV